MKCPLCGSATFFLRDPQDEYETYGFSTRTGQIRFDSPTEEAKAPPLTDDTETFCVACAWHGQFRKLHRGT